MRGDNSRCIRALLELGVLINESRIKQQTERVRQFYKV